MREGERERGSEREREEKEGLSVAILRSIEALEKLARM